MVAIPLTARALVAFDPTILLPGVYLASALLVGAAVIALVRRWIRGADPTQASDAGDQLAHFRTLYENGQISEEEYRRLRTVLGGELRRTYDLPVNRSTSESVSATPPPPIAPTGESPQEGIRPA